jgi:hypothetical protein
MLIPAEQFELIWSWESHLVERGESHTHDLWFTPGPDGLTCKFNRLCRKGSFQNWSE